MVSSPNELAYATFNGVKCPIRTASVALVSTGDQQVVAAVSKKRIALLAFVLSGASTSTVYFTDGTNQSGSIPVTSGSPVVAAFGGGAWFIGANETALKINASVNISGQLVYCEVPLS